MEEMKTNEVIETGIVEESTDVLDLYDDDYESEEDSNVIGTVVKVAAGAALAAGGVVVVKQIDKIKAAWTNHKIKSLKKKGYHVFDPSVEVDYEELETSESEPETTEKE